jgi:outer membrane protein
VKDDGIQDLMSLGRCVCTPHVGWLIGTLFGALSCQAQTLMDVYQKARVNDAQYAAARKSYDAALEKLPQSIAGLLPSVNVVANRNHQIGEGVFSGDVYSGVPSVSRDIRIWNWTTQLTQPLIRWGNWANISQANAQVEQAKEQLALAEQELIVRATQAYFDVQVAMQNVQVADAQLAAVNEQLVLAERTFGVGMGTITDVHEAKAKQALSLAQRVTSLNDLTTKQAELERVVGELMPLTVMQLTQSLPPVHSHELTDWLTAAVSDSPQVRIQQAALQVARHEVSKSMSAHAPTLDIVANRAANFSSGTLSSPADLSTRVNSHQTGLQLTIPLFAGGATQSKVRESVALAEKAKDDLTGAQRNASSQVRQAFAGVVNGQAQVEALEAAVVAGRNAVESNKIGFQIGTRINPDVLNAEQQLYTTLRDLSKARVDAVMQGLKLKAATGSLAAEDLLVLERMMVPAATATQLVQSN